QPAPQAQQPAPAASAPAPRPQPRLSGPTIQVGAFPSQAAAEGEWRRLAARFSYLGALQHQVMVHQRGGQTFYRLRAAGADASAVCRRLRAAGQPCMDVND
ncbi:SPOR domain-containing protein, partial [Sphingosinicella sp. YJ22]|uniref:SPOR domain-containing protein n=1 Tax=Sphingosinicella sp. YJ22 TaxID=1104780 RepID=UPI00140A854D